MGYLSRIGFAAILLWPLNTAFAGTNQYISGLSPVGSVGASDLFADCVAGTCNSSTPTQSASAGALSTFFNAHLPSLSLTGAVTGSGALTGPITTSISNSGVTAGSYTNTNITVNAAGQVTAASNGSGGGGGTIIIGSTPVSGGTNGFFIYNNGGVVGNQALSYAQLPAISANQVLGALTNTTPSGLSVPSCSGSNNALTWTLATGFGCNTIATSGSPGGSNTQVQYNNSGVFGGSSGITLSSTKVTSMSVGLGSDTTGDTYYLNSGANLARLGIGANNSVYTVSGGLPSWQTTLAGLTLTSPTINGGTLSGTLSGNFTLSGIPTLSGLAGGSCNNNLVLNSSNALVTVPCTAGTVTNVGLTTPAWLTVTGTPITSSGTFAVTATTGQTANEFLATPNGTTGAVGLRTLVNADLPSTAVTPGSYTNASITVNQQGVLTSAANGSTAITSLGLGPGIGTSLTTFNTGSQTATAGSTIYPQQGVANQATSFTLTNLDLARTDLITANSVTVTVPTPSGVLGNYSIVDLTGTHAFTVSGSTFSGCVIGSSISVPAGWGVQLGDLGSSYSCSLQPLAPLTTYANTWTALQTFDVSDLVSGTLSGTSITPTLNTANDFTLTLSGATTIAAPTGIVSGHTEIVSFTVTQAAGGGDTVTWNAAYKWAGGTAPTMTSTASAVDVYTGKCYPTGPVCYMTGVSQNLH